MEIIITQRILISNIEIMNPIIGIVSTNLGEIRKKEYFLKASMYFLNKFTG